MVGQATNGECPRRAHMNWTRNPFSEQSVRHGIKYPPFQPNKRIHHYERNVWLPNNAKPASNSPLLFSTKLYVYIYIDRTDHCHQERAAERIQGFAKIEYTPLL